MNNVIFFTGVVILLAGLLFFFGESPADLEKEQQTYCEMVSLWHEDTARGIDPLERRGWAPYKGECEEGEKK